MLVERGIEPAYVLVGGYLAWREYTSARGGRHDSALGPLTGDEDRLNVVRVVAFSDYDS